MHNVAWYEEIYACTLLPHYKELPRIKDKNRQK